MSKEAMKLALEALENSVDLVREDAYQAEKLYGNYPTRQGKVNGLKVLADDHEKAITALREALAEQPAQQEPVAWQLIETAPQDGTKILGWNEEFGARETQMNFYGEGSIGFAAWKSGKGSKESGWDWSEPKNNGGFTWRPTHWMPLLTPFNTSPLAQRPRVVFPTMLRKMWSGSEVQAWLDETVNK